jgi:hypothetical protein
MVADFIVRVSDGNNFNSSSSKKIWGINSNNGNAKGFIKKVQPGDRLWFIKNKSDGKIIAVATYISHNKREFGPLLDISFSNKELGWQQKPGENKEWDTELHYKDLYNVEECNLLTYIKGSANLYEKTDKCELDLKVEYNCITRYSKATLSI